jgi:plasmid stabilization system protein ParE
LKLHWSRLALIDRNAIFSHIESDSPRAAVAGTRELIITNTSYIAAYIIDGDVIRILRVLHTAQLWPEQFLDV